MTRSRDTELLPLDFEIEKTCWRNRRACNLLTSLHNTMIDSREEGADIKALHDYVTPTVMDTISRIKGPLIPINNFEIKLAIIQMIETNQFGGSQDEDLNAHIANFLEICNTFKHNGVTNDAIRLKLFPFSLRDKAKSWLYSLLVGSLTICKS